MRMDCGDVRLLLRCRGSRHSCTHGRIPSGIGRRVLHVARDRKRKSGDDDEIKQGTLGALSPPPQHLTPTGLRSLCILPREFDLLGKASKDDGPSTCDSPSYRAQEGSRQLDQVSRMIRHLSGQYCFHGLQMHPAIKDTVAYRAAYRSLKIRHTPPYPALGLQLLPGSSRHLLLLLLLRQDLDLVMMHTQCVV